MNISGKIRVFKNNVNGVDLYSTSIVNKNKDGEYERMFISVQLPKGTDLQNGTEIIIIQGFLTFYNDRNNMQKLKAVIQCFKEEKDLIEKQEEREAIQNESNYESNYYDDDLPF